MSYPSYQDYDDYDMDYDAGDEYTSGDYTIPGGTPPLDTLGEI